MHRVQSDLHYVNCMRNLNNHLQFKCRATLSCCLLRCSLLCSVLCLAKPRQLIDADVDIVAGLEICQMVRLMVYFHFLFQVSEIISHNIISAAKLLALTAWQAETETERSTETENQRKTETQMDTERERESARECKADRCRGSHK